MMEVLDQIKQMMKVPDTPIDAGDALQWQPRLQRLLFVLQVDLPADFIEFCKVYGSGRVRGDNRSFEIISPFRPSFCEFVLGECRGQFRYKDSCEITGMPFLIFPEQGGFLPFAQTDSGGLIGWITSGSSELWNVVDMSVYDHDGYQETGLTFLGYIKSLLSGELRLAALRNKPFLGAKSVATFTPAHPRDPIA